MIKMVVGLCIVWIVLLTACEKLIQGPDNGNNQTDTGNVRAKFSSIQAKVFTPTCAVPQCHGGTQDPNLSAGQAYNNLVNKSSIESPTLLRVKPGDSNNSFLMKKLNGDGTTRMPLGGELSQVEIDSIALWINNGALNN
jgi:hypothetical protein